MKLLNNTMVRENEACCLCLLLPMSGICTTFALTDLQQQASVFKCNCIRSDANFGKRKVALRFSAVCF